MTFEQQFAQGIEYRSQFDSTFSLDETSRTLLESTFAQTSEKAMQEPFFSIRQGICAQAIAYASNTNVTPFSYQSLADSHTFLRACIDHKFLDEKYMTLTVGDVSFEGKRLFNASRSSIEQCVHNGITTIDTPKFHVWLTLVDMTVIDLTIITQLVDMHRLPEPVKPAEWLNVWRPDRKGRFDYHPILIDDDFLSRLKKPVH